MSVLASDNETSTGRGFGQRAITAGQWRIASAALKITLQFPVGVLLARLLLPADFGLEALSLVVTGFVTLASDLGLGSAIIQQRALTERHLRVALTASFFLGVSIAGLVVLMAPLIGRAADNPDLVPILRVQSIFLVTAGCGAVAGAMLQRQLDFRRLFFIDVTSYTVGYALVAIAGALSGLGVWSLILGILAQGALTCLLSIHAANAPLRPLLARRELGQLLGFGIGVSMNDFVSYIGQNGDNFFVGRLLGPSGLGYYSRAFNLMMMPINYVTSAFFSILVPTFAGMQDERRRMGRGFLLSVQLTAIIVVPVAAAMIIAAPHLILGLYGDRWEGAIRPLQVLCTVALPRAVLPLLGTVNRACNRVVTELWFQCGFAGAVVGGTIAGSRHGIIGVAVAVSLAITLFYIALSSLALRLTKLTWRAFIVAQMPGMLVGLVLAVIAVALRITLERAEWSHVSVLAALVLAGAMSIPLGVYLLPARLRPTELFSRLTPSLKRLPAPLRVCAMFVLRTAR